MRLPELLPKLLLAAFLALLAACSGLLPELAGMPPALYELRAPTPEGLQANPDIKTAPSFNAQILVDIPQSSAGIDTPRIALIKQNGTLAYFQNVSWTDRAPVMFQTLLVDSYDHTGRLPAVGRENMGLRADYLVKSELGAVQADYTKGTPPEAVVELKLKLVTMPRRVIIASNGFQSRIPTKTDTLEDITTALQRATDDVLAQATRWTLNEIAAQSRQKKEK